MATNIQASLTLSAEGSGIRVQTSFPLDFNGRVDVSVVVPTANLTILELQAQACDLAATALAKQAGVFRQASANAQK